MLKSLSYQKWSTLILIIIVSTAFYHKSQPYISFKCQKQWWVFDYFWGVIKEWHLASHRTNAWSLKSTKPPKNISWCTCNDLDEILKTCKVDTSYGLVESFPCCLCNNEWMTWWVLFGMQRNSHESIWHLYSACGLRGIAFHKNHPKMQITFYTISIYESQQWREKDKEKRERT